MSQWVIPYHVWHEHFNPPPLLALEISNRSTFSLNSKVVDPSSAPEFLIFFPDPLEIKCDCLKLPSNGKLVLSLPPSKKSARYFLLSKSNFS